MVAFLLMRLPGAGPPNPRFSAAADRVAEGLEAKHSHRHCLERRNGTTIFNPGECAGHICGRNAVGIVDLEELACETLLF